MKYIDYYKYNLKKNLKEALDPALIDIGNPKFKLMLYWLKSPLKTLAVISPVISESTDIQKNRSVLPNNVTLKFWTVAENYISKTLLKDTNKIKNFIYTIKKIIFKNYPRIDCVIMPYFPSLEKIMMLEAKALIGRYVVKTTKNDLGFSKLTFLIGFKKGLSVNRLLHIIGVEHLKKICEQYNKKDIPDDIISELETSIEVKNINSLTDIDAIIKSLQTFYTDDKEPDAELLLYSLLVKFNPNKPIDLENDVVDTTSEEEISTDENPNDEYSEEELNKTKKV